MLSEHSTYEYVVARVRKPAVPVFADNWAVGDIRSLEYKVQLIGE
jgi:hypothetical protein